LGGCYQYNPQQPILTIVRYKTCERSKRQKDKRYTTNDKDLQIYELQQKEGKIKKELQTFLFQKTIKGSGKTICFFTPI
jgi:hypothetical protein